MHQDKRKKKRGGKRFEQPFFLPPPPFGKGRKKKTKKYNFTTKDEFIFAVAAVMEYDTSTTQSWCSQGHLTHFAGTDDAPPRIAAYTRTTTLNQMRDSVLYEDAAKLSSSSAAASLLMPYRESCVHAGMHGVVVVLRYAVVPILLLLALLHIAQLFFDAGLSWIYPSPALTFVLTSWATFELAFWVYAQCQIIGYQKRMVINRTSDVQLCRAPAAFSTLR